MARIAAWCPRALFTVRSSGSTTEDAEGHGGGRRRRRGGGVQNRAVTVSVNATTESSSDGSHGRVSDSCPPITGHSRVCTVGMECGPRWSMTPEPSCRHGSTPSSPTQSVPRPLRSTDSWGRGSSNRPTSLAWLSSFKLLHAIFGLFKTDSLWDATRFCGPVQGAQETGANLVARIGPQ